MSMRTVKNMEYDKVLKLISEDNLRDALKVSHENIHSLKKIRSTKTNEIEKELILIKASLESYEKQRRIGTISFDGVEIQRIRTALLDITYTMKEEYMSCEGNTNLIANTYNSHLTLIDSTETSLIQNGVSVVPPSTDPVANGYREVELTINREIENYSEKEKAHLLAAIGSLLRISGEIKIRGLVSGSIKLLIELPVEIANELTKLIEGGALKAYDVLAAKITKQNVSYEDKSNTEKDFPVENSFTRPLSSVGRTITFNELRRIKNSLPIGSMETIAKELGISVETVRNYFGGANFRKGESVGFHIEPGPDGGVVQLDDTRILERAFAILGHATQEYKSEG